MSRLIFRNLLVILAIYLIFPAVVGADNCGSLTDCYRSLQAAMAASAAHCSRCCWHRASTTSGVSSAAPG